MNEKEQALAMVKSFEGLVYPYMGSDYMTDTQSPQAILHNAKTCALIEVQGIINANPHSNPLNTNPVVSTMKYWLGVKKEIENIKEL